MLNNVSSLIISHIPTQNGKLCVFIRPPSFPVLPPRGTPSATPSQRNRLIHLTLPRAIRYLLPRETIPFALQNHTYCLAKPYVLPSAPSAPPPQGHVFRPARTPKPAFPTSPSASRDSILRPENSHGGGAETPPSRPAIYHNGDWRRIFRAPKAEGKHGAGAEKFSPFCRFEES